MTIWVKLADGRVLDMRAGRQEGYTSRRVDPAGSAVAGKIPGEKRAHQVSQMAKVCPESPVLGAERRNTRAYGGRKKRAGCPESAKDVSYKQRLF